jgi:hypothetical protein
MAKAIHRGKGRTDAPPDRGVLERCPAAGVQPAASRVQSRGHLPLQDHLLRSPNATSSVAIRRPVATPAVRTLVKSESPDRRPRREELGSPSFPRSPRSPIRAGPHRSERAHARRGRPRTPPNSHAWTALVLIHRLVFVRACVDHSALLMVCARRAGVASRACGLVLVLRQCHGKTSQNTASTTDPRVPRQEGPP